MRPQDNASKTESNLLTLLPGGIYLLLMILTMPVPYVLYASLVDSGQTPVDGWLQPFVYALLTTLILAWVMRTGQPDAIFLLISAVCLVLVEFVFYSNRVASADLYGYPLLLLLILYRLRRWQSAPSFSQENHSSFLFETVCTLLSTLFLVLTETQGGIREWLVFVLVVSLALRLFAMWQVERLENVSKGAKGNFGLMIIGVIALVWLGPKLLYWAILALAGGGGILSIPLIYLLSAILPKNLFAKSLGQQQPFQKLLTQVRQQHRQGPQVHSLSWIPYVFYALVLMVAIYLSWRAWRGRLEAETNRDSQASVTIARQRLSGRLGLQYVATRNQVRLRYQKMLAENEKAGHPIMPTESPRQYQERLFGEELYSHDAEAHSREKHSRDSPGGEDLKALTNAYEKERYGKHEG